MTSIKTSLKSSIDSASFQTISQLSKVAQLPNRRKFVLEMKRGGPRPGSDRDGRIYRLAVPVLTKKLKIWSFHVVVVRGRQRKIQKRLNARADLLLFFC